MSDEEKKDPEDPAKPAEWEDSHTAASLPSWWHADKEPGEPATEQKPAAAPAGPQPEATPASAPPMPPASSAAPTEPPVNWEVSPTAKELPTWWRPEEPPATAAQHAAPTVPPTPHPAPSPAPPAPPAISPQMAAVPPPAAVTTPPTPHMPPPSSPPTGRHERTMVLGVMPAAGPPMAILVVKSGPDMGFKFRLKPAGIAYLGRDLENEVVLDDPAASRRHAHIQFKDGAYTLTDLGSANGTLVNDQTISERKLVNGDRITVGQDVIVISIM